MLQLKIELRYGDGHTFISSNTIFYSSYYERPKLCCGEMIPAAPLAA